MTLEYTMTSFIIVGTKRLHHAHLKQSNGTSFTEDMFIFSFIWLHFQHGTMFLFPVSFLMAP